MRFCCRQPKYLCSGLCLLLLLDPGVVCGGQLKRLVAPLDSLVHMDLAQRNLSGAGMRDACCKGGREEDIGFVYKACAPTQCEGALTVCVLAQDAAHPSSKHRTILAHPNTHHRTSLTVEIGNCRFLRGTDIPSYVCPQGSTNLCSSLQHLHNCRQ